MPRFDLEREAWVREPDPVIYSRQTAWPEEAVEIEEVRFRDLRLARVLVYPARYDPASRQVLLADWIRVRIDFSGGGASRAPAGRWGALEDRIADRSLLNRETVQAFRSVRTRPQRRLENAVATPPPAPLNPGVKIRVGREGLVRVTRAELQALGFDPTGVDPRNLELSHRGTPVPCRVPGEADGSFDAGDAVEFYGVPGAGRFSDETVYWLQESGQPGLRFPQGETHSGSGPVASTFPHVEHYEDANDIYRFGDPAQEGDPHFFWAWFEDNPNPPRVTTLVRTATLPGLDTSGDKDSLFRVFFAGRSDPPDAPDHHVRFSVNGTEIGETTWDGIQFHSVEITFDSDLLTTGNNEFRIDFVFIAFPDSYYLDWFEIEYPRSVQAVSDQLVITGEGSGPAQYPVAGIGGVNDALALDVTDPLAPVQLTDVTISGSGPFTVAFDDQNPGGRRFLVAGDGGRIAADGLEMDVPSSLRDAANGADLIVVVPDGWETALSALVAHRQAEGRRVVVAGLTDIADEFAGGNVDDVAIRDFVAHAYDNWQAPPVSSVLLVGEPNLDVLNHLGTTPFYHLMPSHIDVTVGWGETISDTWFGAVAGNDPLPDVAVGRFSVRTAAAAADLAAKVIDYETQPQAAWARNALLISSNDPEFEAALDGAALHLPGHFTVNREYRSQGATTASIGGAFDAGAAIASFFGHGNFTAWGESYGVFFTTTDAASIVNPGRLPFLTAANCLNGLVANPYYVDTLSEAFHNPPDTGALAMWSPSSTGYVGIFDDLQSNLYRTIFEDGVPYLGEATTSALVETYLTTTATIDLVKEMVLLGDPSGWLNIDSDDDTFLDVQEVAHGLNPADRDTDDDGLIDPMEGGLSADADGDGVVNGADPDVDQDGLPDGLETGIQTPDPDTDVSRGFFRADTHPASTTLPFDPDTDGGGAPDGVEDRDADGAVGPGETDPQDPADDPACGAGPPPEIAAAASEHLEITRSGDDLVLTWGDISATEPCVLYRIYISEDLDGSGGGEAFRVLAVTALPTYTHRGVVAAPELSRYLVVGATPGGEGPWGHFDP